MVKIALVSCGTEYSGIQKEIEKAANTFGAEIILPEIDLVILMNLMPNLDFLLKVQV